NATGADAFADGIALGLEFAMVDKVRQRRAGGVGKGRGDLRIARLQCARDAGQAAAGAGRADEAVDGAVHVVPDFRAGDVFVQVAIGGVVELVGKPGAALGFVVHGVAQAFGAMHVMVGIGKFGG